MVKRAGVAVLGLVVLVGASCAKPAPSGRVLDPSSTTTALAVTVPTPVAADLAVTGPIAASFPFCPEGTPVLAVVAPIPKGMSGADAVTSGRIAIARPGDKWRPATALTAVTELTGTATYDIGVGAMLVDGSFAGTSPAATTTDPGVTSGPCEQPIADFYVATAPLAAGSTLALTAAAGAVRAASGPRTLIPADSIADLTANGPKVFAIEVPPGTIIVPALFR